MIRNIALALTVAAISTSAAAQSNRKQPTWDDLLKPVEVKTNPAIPLAPPQQPAAPAPTPQTTGNTALLDGCVITAIGRLPKADGLRVTHSSYEHFESGQLGGSSAYAYEWQLWVISISVDLQGRQANYQWRCRIIDNKVSELLK